MELITQRVSGLPEVLRCPGAARVPDLRIRPDPGQPAEMGSAVHVLLADVVNQDLTSTSGLDVADVAKRFGVDLDELWFLTRQGVKMWALLRGSFLGAVAEAELEATVGGVRITGHPDLFTVRGNKAAGLDWKAGRVDRNYREQMRGYLALVLLNWPEVDEAVFTIAWLREAEIETYTMDRAGLVEWGREIRSKLVAWDGVFVPGEHCIYCPRSHECPALIAMARRDLAILADESLADRIERGLIDLTPAEVVGLRRKAKLIEKICASLDEATRRRVNADGELDAGDGKVLRFVESNRRELDPLKAWPVIEAKLTVEELALAVKLRAGVLDDLVAKKAGKGKGAAAKRALAEELEKAGAVTVVVTRQLREVRK